jgi:hypothetical protein
MKINAKIVSRLIAEGVTNGVYFFKDTKRKPKAADRIRTIYDGCEFISDTGRTRDEVYEASSITILFDGKRKTISSKDISDGGVVKVCIRYGANNYEWKYLY